MAVTNEDCVQAGKDVINKIRMYLPEGFLTKYSVETNIGSYYNVLSGPDYKQRFDAFYDGFFAATFGKGGISYQQVSGFVTPAPHYNRKIYIQDPIGANKGTIRHEFLHWVQHYDFYPKYYIKGGTKSADVVEGITEYFTRTLITGRTSYPRQYKKMKSLVDANPSLIHTLGNAAFFGDATSIQKIHGLYWG